MIAWSKTGAMTVGRESRNRTTVRSFHRRRNVLPVAVVSVLVIALTGACSAFAQTVPGHARAVDLAHPPSGPLSGDEPLTDADLAAVSPAQLLDESLFALFTRQVLHVRMESVGDVPAYLAGGEYAAAVSEGGFDFRNNQYAYRKVDGFDTICVDGAKYQLIDEEAGRWVDSSGCAIEGGSDLARTAASLELTGTVSDGILTAGLTPEEAKAFIGAMHSEYPGFLDPGPLTLAEHDGRQYIRMPVVFRALDLDGDRFGMQLFTWSFREIGPRWRTHILVPGTAGAMVSQVEAVYYIDPASRLPAYTESLIYEPEDDPTASTGSVERVEYIWDDTVPHPEPAPGTPKPQPPMWPVERIAPSE
jgi:hypothetical protein